jgi:hypothetical protein
MDWAFDLKVKIEPVTTWLNKNERWLLNLASTLIALLLLYRAFWYGGDWVSVIACSITAVIIFAAAYDIDYPSDARGIRVTRVVLLGLLLSSWCVVGFGGSGYWVNARNGETTFTRYWLVSMPWPQPIYWVPQDLGQTVSIKVTTRDDVPLTCDIQASGIKLDERVGYDRLEREFVAVSSAGPIEPRINGSLRGRLAQASVDVLKTRTSEEITRQSQFLIPHQIGTPLGDLISRHFLRWDKGEVSAKCRVLFES